MRKAREDAGLSLRVLADKAKTSHTTLLAYESGKKSPSVATYFRILEAAGYSVSLDIHKRIREQDGIKRGDELAEVLKLAACFPARIPRKLDFPILKSELHHGSD